MVDNQHSTITEDGATDTLFCGPGAVNPDAGLAAGVAVGLALWRLAVTRRMDDMPDDE